MSLQYNINNLPYDLQDKIHNYYWSNIFYENVVKHFKMLNKYIKKINSFINNIFLKTRNYEGDICCYYKLCTMNIFLQNVYNCRASFLYLKGFCKNIKHLKFYKSYLCKNISEKIKLIAFYTVSYSSIMRYIIYDRFVNISKEWENNNI